MPRRAVIALQLALPRADFVPGVREGLRKANRVIGVDREAGQACLWCGCDDVGPWVGQSVRLHAVEKIAFRGRQLGVVGVHLAGRGVQQQIHVMIFESRSHNSLRCAEFRRPCARAAGHEAER